MSYYNFFMKPSRVRFVNNAMNEPINIYLNNQEIIRGLNYQQITQFIPLQSGMYNIKIYSTSNDLLLNEDINIISNKLITINKNSNGIMKLNVTDDLEMTNYNEVKGTQTYAKAKIRFAHFSPNSPAVDIVLENGNTLFRNIDYRTITDYIMIIPGSYNLHVKLSGTNQILLTIPEFILTPNDSKTIYAIGLLDASPMLETLIIKD